MSECFICGEEGTIENSLEYQEDYMGKGFFFHPDCNEEALYHIDKAKFEAENGL